MFSRAITIMRVSGIPIRIDASWLIVAVVMTWSLAEMLAEKFPSKTYPELTIPSYWLMAGVVALGFFVCIVLHELGHSLVGQRFGMRIRSITLFVFGGVAELEAEPTSAKAEFYMAAAGPLVSVLLAGVFWLLSLVGEGMGWGVGVVAILGHLALLNAVVVGFNMVPAFPLDGGRVLRAILWASMHSLKRATKVTSRMGQGFGSLMMFMGLVGILTGMAGPGLWWLVLGWILRNAAQSGYTQVIVRAALEGEPVRRFMTPGVLTVRPELTVEELVEDHLYKEHHRLYPVSDNGRVLGYVTPSEIKELPRETWPSKRVSDVMVSNLEPLQLSPDADALDALSRMQRSGQSRLLVVDHGSLVGILTLRDLLDFLHLKIELEET
jgi:Zn-dependent protease/predicted transcriptional regulator